MSRFVKLSHSVYYVENQNGFNNALYGYFANDYGVDNPKYTKERIRKMVRKYPKKYPISIVIEDLTEELEAIFIECFDMEIALKKIKTNPRQSSKTL